MNWKNNIAEIVWWRYAQWMVQWMMWSAVHFSWLFFLGNFCWKCFLISLNVFLSICLFSFFVQRIYCKKRIAYSCLYPNHTPTSMLLPPPPLHPHLYTPTSTHPSSTPPSSTHHSSSCWNYLYITEISALHLNWIPSSFFWFWPMWWLHTCSSSGFSMSERGGGGVRWRSKFLYCYSPYTSSGGGCN